MHPKVDYRPAKAAALPQLIKPVSHVPTQQLDITNTDLIVTGIGIYVVINLS